MVECRQIPSHREREDPFFNSRGQSAIAEIGHHQMEGEDCCYKYSEDSLPESSEVIALKTDTLGFQPYQREVLSPERDGYAIVQSR